MKIFKNNSTLNHLIYKLNENPVIYINVTDREDIYFLQKHYSNKEYAIKLNSLKEFYYIVNNYPTYLQNHKQLHIVCFCKTTSDYIPWDMKIQSEENNIKSYYRADNVKNGIIDYALYKNVPVTVQSDTTTHTVGWVRDNNKYRRTKSRKEWEDLNEFYIQQNIDIMEKQFDNVDIPENAELYKKIEDLLLFSKDFNIDITINLSNTDGVDTMCVPTTKKIHEYVERSTQKEQQLFSIKYLSKHLTDVDIARIEQSHSALQFFMDMWRNKIDLTEFFDPETTIICPECGYPVQLVRDSKKGYCSAFGDFPGNCTITYQTDIEATQCNGCGCKPLQR